MSLAHLQQNFLKLSWSLRLIGISSLILGVATLLPWYADLDVFRVGDMFLGITGPASFVGIAILLLSLGSFGIFLAHLLEKRAPKLPIKESVFHLLVGIESLFLLFIVNSIYFHPKFGVNITLKESRFGMLLALLAGAALTFGAYVEMRKEKKTEDYIGKLEPLVQVKPEVSKPAYAKPSLSSQSIHGTQSRPSIPTVKPPYQPLERKHQPFVTKQGMVERAEQELIKERQHIPLERSKIQEKSPIQPELISTAEPIAPESEKQELPPSPSQTPKQGGGSFMIRTDL